MKKRHRATLERIFDHPINGSIRWYDIEALFFALGAEISTVDGGRVVVALFGEMQVFHAAHPSSADTSKEVVTKIRKWLESHNITPSEPGL